jgi:hypothetical protein
MDKLVIFKVEDEVDGAEVGAVTVYDPATDQHREENRVGIPYGLDAAGKAEYGITEHGWMTREQAQAVADTHGAKLTVS